MSRSRAFVDVRRADDRPRTTGPGTTTRHSLSAGRHYDPANTSFGPLVLHDEHLLEPGAGFDPHPHRDLEIVTWLLRGALVHRDGTGHADVVGPGQVALTRAGRGVRHSERADHVPPSPARLLQMWLLPDEVGLPPARERWDASAALRAGGLVALASGRDDGAPLRLACLGAVLHAAWLPAGAAVELPAADRLHVFVTSGALDVQHDLSHHVLGEGDAVRLVGSAGLRVRASEAAEVLVWELPGD
jgi:redox-sensitive bicupin YhaK (pirin superfamily)